MGSTHPIIADAERIAMFAHAGQVDKIGEEYIRHPAAVVHLLQTLPAYRRLSPRRQVLASAIAWLHDALEDSALTAQDLVDEGMPEEVGQAVTALTHVRHEPRSQYYARVRQDPLAHIVKIADVAHNSSPERLRWLDPDTRARLEHKYQVAAQALLTSDEDRAWFAGVAESPPVRHSPR
jgi:(p)ppGpp synthase/HD superfamily hydrolase